MLQSQTTSRTSSLEGPRGEHARRNKRLQQDGSARARITAIVTAREVVSPCGTLRRGLGAGPRVAFIAARTCTEPSHLCAISNSTPNPLDSICASQEAVLDLITRLSEFQHRALRYRGQGML
jgi:hypothetical protein